MPMIILDGKTTASKMREEMSDEVRLGLSKGWRSPALAVILVGEDPASQIYVRNKQKACADTGITSIPFILPSSTSTQELMSLIADLNARSDVDGILLQLPLPGHIDEETCLEAIHPEKDVDGFHPVNMGRLCQGLPGFVPCTPAGALELLRRHGFDLAGKKAVVVGRSNIVGKPLAMLLASRETNATVTICHSCTDDLKKECLNADFLFLAMGKPAAITGDMIPEGCVVVDIGINRTENGLVGDVDFASACARASAITPVPGGIGPMTIAMLLRNTLKSWRQHMEQTGRTDGKALA